jgi:Cu(I)/Ag(I) efflux system membrane fusion protein
VTQAQVDAILRSGKADFTLPIVAPIGGPVVRKEVVEGQYVSEGQLMFEVADLHSVWVKAQVYEDQVGLVRVGQEVEATVAAFPGEVFKGKVAFLQTHLDPTTRTLEVRYDLANPGHKLRPGFFATVTLRTPMAETPMFRGRIASSRAITKANPTVAEQENCPVTGGKLGSMGDPVAIEAGGRKVWTCCGACPPKILASPAKYLARLEPPPVDGVLSVPESAVIDTGALTMVYVEAEPGVFEGRKVVLGPRNGVRFPVLEGLEPGESVVANGAFLVDAESRLDPSTRPETPKVKPAPAPEPVGRSANHDRSVMVR